MVPPALLPFARPKSAARASNRRVRSQHPPLRLSRSGSSGRSAQTPPAAPLLALRGAPGYAPPRRRSAMATVGKATGETTGRNDLEDRRHHPNHDATQASRFGLVGRHCPLRLPTGRHDAVSHQASGFTFTISSRWEGGLSGTIRRFLKPQARRSALSMFCISRQEPPCRVPS